MHSDPDLVFDHWKCDHSICFHRLSAVLPSLWIYGWIWCVFLHRQRIRTQFHGSVAARLIQRRCEIYANSAQIVPETLRTNPSAHSDPPASRAAALLLCVSERTAALIWLWYSSSCSSSLKHKDCSVCVCFSLNYTHTPFIYCLARKMCEDTKKIYIFFGLTVWFIDNQFVIIKPKRVINICHTIILINYSVWCHL